MRLRLTLGKPSPAFLRVLAVLALLAGGVNLYLFVYQPYAAATAALRREGDALEAQVAELRRQARAQQEALRELAAVEAEARALASSFPAELDEARVVEFWDQAARAAGVRVTGIRWGEVGAAGAFSRRPVELDVQGPYAGQQQFAFALQGMPWLHRLDAVTLAGEEQAPADGARAAPAGADQTPMPGAVRATYTVEFFLDAPPPAGSAGAPAGGAPAGGTAGAAPAAGAASGAAPEEEGTAAGR